ncbi:MAG: tetratricopeptide repeat protein [Bacteroidia bacterium]|nr:tetratricopeptide repeat protein [Bacteroidia bacterium]
MAKSIERRAMSKVLNFHCPKPFALRSKPKAYIMDEELDISSLVERYEQMQLFGKKIYFDADEFAMLADYYNSLGDNKEAEDIINEGLIMHPASPELMILKAKTLVFSELYDEALSYLNNIPDEGDIELPLLRIESLLHLNKTDEANEIINETMSKELSIDDLYVFITEIGYVMNDIDNFDRAISYLEESLKIDDSNPDVLIDLAYANEMKGDFERAIEYNNQLLDIDPYSFEGWINIGKLYSMNEEFNKAIDAFDFALTINENDVSALKMKALSLYLNDNAPEAIRIFEECIRISPDDESLYDSLLEGYEAMEQYDQMAHIINIKEERFGTKGITTRRAFLELLKDNFPEAHDLYNKIPEDEKESLDYYMLEGELTFIGGDLRAAEAAYIKAALLSENNEEIIDRLANVSVAQEKYEQAAGYLKQLLDIAPDYPTAKSRLAFIRFEIGTKEPFDEIMKQFSDDELRALLHVISGNENADFSSFDRQKMLIRLNEARENRVLFKNIKY